jgi:hypothetical protein
MLGPEMRWNKALKGTAYGLARRGPKDLFCGSIEQNDPLVSIRADDRVHRRLQNPLNFAA